MTATNKSELHTLSIVYKQRFISNDFETSQIFKKNKQQTSLFLKKLATTIQSIQEPKQQ